MNYSDDTYKFISQLHNITLEQSKEIMIKSDSMMPILLTKYGDDLNMITEKMRQYQKIVLNNFLKKYKN